MIIFPETLLHEYFFYNISYYFNGKLDFEPHFQSYNF